MTGQHKLVFWIFSGVLGAVIGSFLNVCIFRLPRNCMSLVRPRSRCPRCLRLIPWYDNLPVLSWILLGGRCRGCGAVISPRYLAVEVLTGIAFLFIAWRQLYGVPHPGGTQAVLFAVHAAFVSALLVCTFIDLEFRILPDEITIWGTVIALGLSAAFPVLHPERTRVIAHPHFAALATSALGAAVGAGLIFAVGTLGKYVFRKEAMGFGDVKYMAMIGALLGWWGALMTFVAACLLGSIYGIGKFIVVRRMGYVAFGPFLSAGAVVMLFWPHLAMDTIRAYMRLIHFR